MRTGISLKRVIVVMVCAAMAVPAYTQPRSKPKVEKSTSPASSDGIAEARLIEIYRLIGTADTLRPLGKPKRL